MSTVGVAKRYAEALMDIAIDKGREGAYGAELDHIVDTIEGHEALKNAFYGIQFSTRDKQAALRRIFKDDLSEDVLHFLLLLVEKNRYPLLEEIREAYYAIRDRQRGVLDARITSAYPLSDEEVERLRSSLAKINQVEEIRLREEVDPGLIAGIRLQIGDLIMDGSAKARLESIRTNLVHGRKQEVNR